MIRMFEQSYSSLNQYLHSFFKLYNRFKIDVVILLEFHNFDKPRVEALVFQSLTLL